MTEPVACWHKEINDEGICKACGAKAAIRLPFSVEEFNDMLRIPNASAENAKAEPNIEAGDRALETARKIEAIFERDIYKSIRRNTLNDVAAEIQSAMDAEPKSLWGWPIEEIKSAMRQFQSAHVGKLPSEVESERREGR